MVDSKRDDLTLIPSSNAHFLHGWRRYAVQEIEETLSNPDFPCIFGRASYKRRDVLYLCVSGEDYMGRLALGLKTFIRDCMPWDGRVDTAAPLIVIFGRDVTPDASKISDYHRYAWNILQEIQKYDTEPWPNSIPMKVEDPLWSFCFDGIPLFINISTPAHVKRRSRNLGSYLTFVINPRERFDVLAGDTPKGRNARKIIRRRIDNYDEIPHSNLLGSYGTGSLEWLQYQLGDSNELPNYDTSCPFRRDNK